MGAQVPRGDEVVPAALEVSPHVALLDIEMPGATGLDAAERLGEALPSCRVLILTTFGRPGYLCRAIPVSRTVRNHLSTVMQKLDTRNRAGAGRMAEERGWL